ncbi:hypothetical protein RhiirA5_423998 [Rhizophagus irregularis]|uniref:Reverse transcriptase domain-containing protein n=1 Tax=Rhizophagus irregularis TaxID=588596 RepID=A0A2N0P8Z2_9GLOM|nr:hypothetical protein RhiirA5_423998 [Rhizophagus irregularis]
MKLSEKVWSSILWRIFYNALLSKLNKLKEETGYNIYEEKIIDKDKDKKEILKISINATAFMDDTTMITKKETAIWEFFQLNEKQIIAVWNIVIIPRIEYQLAAIVLKKSECNKLMTRLNMIIKKRASLARSTSNFVIYEKDILGAKHIYDLQMEMLYALKTLNNENIKLCNHEINNNKGNHRIKEGKIDLIDLIEKKYTLTSARLMKAKDVMLLEDILLEVDGITLLKWKHLCKEKGVNTKGKVPKWFSDLERNEDKKRSQSKNHKRIGIYLELAGDQYDMNNSPYLKACEGCSRNISKKKGSKECLIYIDNEISRKIERCKEEEFIKPYETLNNIIKKNTRHNQKQIKVNEKGKRIYFYNIIWKIKELDLEEDSKEEIMFLAKHKCKQRE